MSRGPTYFGLISPREIAGFFSFKRYALLNLFKKVTALTLVLTFSWWQLVWAIDVRKLLWDQENTFQEQEMRRGEGINSEQLTQAQSHVEAEIERQEALQELQNQNFSLTTENGILLEQISQNQVEAQSPDGSVLTTIQLDADGNVIVADLQLSDGSIQIYQNGELIGYLAPDGTQVVYKDGEIQKIVLPDGAEGSLSYIDANHPALVLQNNSKLVFEGGSFSHLLDPQGNKHFYENDKLKRIVLNSGWTLDNIVLSADGATILDYSVLDPQGSLVSDSGFITYPELVPQTLYPYESFKPQAEQTGWLSAIQYDIVAIRDGEGRLTELKLLDLTIHYDPQTGAIDFIEKKDGTEIHDLVFDEKGVIKDALVISPDGEEKLYKDGVLVSISRTDLTKIFFVDGKPQTFITPANLTYNFTYDTPGVIEANLDTSLTIPDATTAVKMFFNEDFSLDQIIRQNEEILSYLSGDLARIDFPTGDFQTFQYVKDETGLMQSFSITEGNTETFYDAAYEPFKAIVHPTQDNPDTLEIIYQFGKIREVYKNGVLTFIYNYAADTDGQEITLIEDLEEKAVKTYKNELLLTSFETETSVLSTYSYLDGKVSEVKVTRLGRHLHTYIYAYEGALTIVTDEEGVIRTYDINKKLIFLLRDNTKFAYTYHQTPDGKEIIEETLIEKTFEDGSIVYYADGQVSYIELPDGSVITDIILDPHRNIVSALVTLTDGTKIIFNGAGILEKILTDGTHYYYENGRIAKVIQPGGMELVYSYDEDQNGSITAIWIEVQNADLMYDPAGNLLGAHLPGILTPEETRAGTQDAYSGGRTQGAWSIDNDFNTAYLNGFGGGAGNSYSSLTSEHTFPAPTTLTQFAYRLDATSYSSGSTDNGSYAYTYIEVKDAKTGKWTTVSGTYLGQNHYNSGGGGSTAFATSANPKTVNITVSNVIAVRARAQAGAYANESGAHGGFAYIYEIQYSLADQTYFNFIKKTNPQGTVTGFSFQGLLGTISYDTQGVLLPGTPASLNQAAQPLVGLVPSLVTTPYYAEVNLSAPPNLESWFSAADEAVLPGDSVVGQEYSQDGVLETQTKADQTVTLYENNKPIKVLSKEGEILIEYAYDADGNPTRVYLKNARDSLPHEVAKAKQEIEEQRAQALLDLAREKNLATGSIEANVETQRQTLLIQLDVLQKQYDSIAAMEVSGKEAKSQKGDALNQIGHAMDDVRNALGDLARDEAAAYAQLDQEVANLAAQLDAEAEEAFTQLAVQETNLKKEILKQEISPIVYDTYRRILGRDPSQTEYEFWTTQVDYNSGETFTEVKTVNGQNLTEALSQYLLSSEELAQREAYVSQVKANVKQAVENYLLLTQTEREVFASSLGLFPGELIALTASDAQKILTWIENQTLHFGQSAFLSLEALLEQKGIAFAREDIAFKAIMVDILAGVITPLDDAELVISVFALDKVAALYGLDLSGAKLTFEDLLTLYQTNPSLKVIAHINQRHFVIITGVTEDSVTYIDTGAGPDKQNEIVTVTKEEFLGVWKGNVALDGVIARSAEGATKQSLRILTDEEAQKIRGAFLPFLFFAIGNAIIGIVNAVIGVITAILGFLNTLGIWLGQILTNIGNALYSLSQGLQYVGKSIFGGIYHAATTLFNAFGTHFATFNSQALVGSLTKASFGEIIFERAVTIGLNFALSKGLEALGVDPTIINIVTAFTRGGLLTAFSANTFTFGAFLQGGLQSAFLAGAQTLGYHLGIDPNLMSVASILGQPLFQGFASGDLFGSLFTNLSNIAGGFASFGFNKLIQSFDLNPDLSMLVTDFFSPFVSDLASGFVNGLMNPITPVIRQGEQTGLTLTEAITNQDQGRSPPGGASLAVDLRNDDLPPLAGIEANSYSYFPDENGNPIALRNPYTGASDPLAPSGATLLLGDVTRYYNPDPFLLPPSSLIGQEPWYETFALSNYADYLDGQIDSFVDSVSGEPRMTLGWELSDTAIRTAADIFKATTTDILKLGTSTADALDDLASACDAYWRGDLISAHSSWISAEGKFLQDLGRVFVVGSFMKGLAGGAIRAMEGPLGLLERNLDDLTRSAELLPEGVSYEGRIVRAVDKDYAGSLWDITDYNIQQSHRYSGPGMGALYTSTDSHTAIREVTRLGDPLSNFKFDYTTAKLDNMLDLTDPTVLSKLNVQSSDLLTRSYEVTQKIGDFAIKNGYNGIIAPSAKSSTGKNIILFEDALKALEKTQ